jgi:hypothetical protein
MIDRTATGAEIVPDLEHHGFQLRTGWSVQGCSTREQNQQGRTTQRALGAQRTRSIGGWLGDVVTTCPAKR